MIPREKCAELSEAFQALSKSEQDIFVMAQPEAMNGGEITASRRLKKRTRTRFITEIAIRLFAKKPVKNFLENYAEIHGLPNPGRNVHRIIQLLTLLPVETSYKSVYRDFIAGLENGSTLKLLKYDAFRKL
ncbi:532_t:CDS:2 [Ambispora leptoticha]|uniref:532_t:CDS:1 n=1 Tax=Ambispora leptoticha TaxID=144679 RepID=A0A9N9BQR0_9GLOM|nr:532_t:CDS:2 [Ambispora leptoticha]